LNAELLLTPLLYSYLRMLFPTRPNFPTSSSDPNPAYCPTLSFFRILTISTPMLKLKWLPLRSFLAKLKWKRKKTPKKSTEVLSVARPTAAPSVTKPILPEFNMRLREIEAIARRTPPDLSLTEFQSPASSSEPQSLAALFARRTESQYFTEDGEVRYLARPYWAPFLKGSARPAANDGTKGRWGYTSSSLANTRALAGIGHSIEGPAVNRSQRIVNAVDRGSISTGLGLNMIG